MRQQWPSRSHNVISSTNDFPCLSMHTAHTFAFQTGHIAVRFSGDGHYQLLVIVLQRHGWNHSLEAVLNEHQHSRREERGRDELVAQCLQSNVPSHAKRTYIYGSKCNISIKLYHTIVLTLSIRVNKFCTELKACDTLPQYYQ